MLGRCTTLLICSVCVLSANAFGATTWILASRDSADELIKVENGTVAVQHALGSVAQYGWDERRLAAISFKRHTGQHHLDVIERATGRLAASWPIVDRTPVTYVEGASPQVAILDQFAYFPTLPAMPHGHLNAGWGEHPFSVSAVALPNGAMTSVSIQNSSNPRVGRLGRDVVVYEQPGHGIRRLKVERFDLSGVTSERARIRIEQEQQALRARSLINSDRPMSLALARHGIFRLSRFGRLEQLLDAEFREVNVGALIDIGSSRDIKAFVLASDGIDVVYKRASAFEVKQTDVRTMRIARTFLLPATAYIDGMHRTKSDSLIYWDRDSGQLIEHTDGRQRVLGRLAPDVYRAVRVIATDE